jgi:heptosyltransferase-2
MKTVVYPTSPGIGDLIWHLPFIRAIAAESEGGTVTVVARSSTLAREWLSPDPAVAEVLYHHRRERRNENRVLEEAGAALPTTTLASELRERGFERAFLFSGRVKPAIILRRAGIPVRAGYGHTLAQRLWLNAPPYTRPYRGPLAPRLYFDAVAFARAHGFIGDTAPPPPRLHVPTEVLDRFAGSLSGLGRSGVVGFSIGASGDRKNWGAERFASLAG